MLWLQSFNLDYAFWVTIISIVVLLLLSAFFSGSETALTAASEESCKIKQIKGRVVLQEHYQSQMITRD